MRYFTLLISICCLSLLSSCSIINQATIYDANALNIPLHKEKKEIKGSTGYGSILGFNTDFSYAATKCISVKAAANYNHQYLIKNRLLGGDHFNLKNHYLEGAAGYYKYLENTFVNSLELSAGYGNGLTNKAVGDRFEGSYHKYFIQLNVGHVTDKFELGIGARYSGIYFPNLYQKIYNMGTDNLEFNHKPLSFPSLEIAVMQGFGGRKLKATVQYGLAIPLKELNLSYQVNNNYSFNQSLDNWSAIFQIGLRYNFLLAKK